MSEPEARGPEEHEKTRHWSGAPPALRVALVAQDGGDVGQKMAKAFDNFAAGGALDYEVLDKTPEAFDLNITECRYAQFYKEMGVPELGFLLVCSADFPMAEGFATPVELKRTQTIMQGASHCDFRYRLKADSGS